MKKRKIIQINTKNQPFNKINGHLLKEKKKNKK